MSRAAEITMGSLLFAGTFALAGVQAWSASDLMWGLWISSLTLGYGTIVLSIVGPLAIGEPSLLLRPKSRVKKSRPQTNPVTPPFHPQIAYLFFVPIVVFMLGFFTVHFGGFHLGHAMFLNQFYPLVPRDDLPQTIGGLANHFGAIVSTALALYWPFVLLSALSMRRGFREAWSGSGSNPMMRPYVNVIRMHLMIFVMAGSVNAGLSDYVLYAAMILYFFPFGVVFRGNRREKQADGGLVESTVAHTS